MKFIIVVALTIILLSNLVLTSYGEEKVLSPLKQFKSGISIHDIKCEGGLVSIIKRTDGEPSCVKSETATKLIQRGWGILSNQTVWFELKSNSCLDVPWMSELIKSKTLTNDTLGQSMDDTGLIRKYFNNHNITLLQVSVHQQIGMIGGSPYSVCLGVSFFLVPQNDTSKMTDLGFQFPTDGRQFAIH